MDNTNLDQAVARYCHFFETLTPEGLWQLEALFEDEALFRDPFNRVRGPAAIRRIFEHMFRHWPHARFEVLESCAAGERAFLRWTFRPDPSRDLIIEGLSRVEFAPGGQVSSHRDYWDSASELYARLPLIGPPTRWLLRRSQADPEDQLSDAPKDQAPRT